MPYWYPALLTEARTGLRLGELIALPWSNVDLFSRTITVSAALSRKEISTTKNKKTREVDMLQQLADTLRALHLQRRKEALAKGQTAIADLVFLTPIGTRLDPKNLRANAFWRALSLAGLRRVRFPNFRLRSRPCSSSKA